MEKAIVNERKKIYVSGPFFKPEERERINKIKLLFSKDSLFLDYELFFPMDHFIPDGDKMSNWEWGHAVFEMDTEALEKCDIVLAVYDKQYSDSGTAWELGYAYGLGIPVVLLCTDINADNSIMPICAAKKIYDFEKFAAGEYWDFDIFSIESLK